MKKPYVICHMVMSVDGCVTGDFLFQKEAQAATEVYYELNRSYKADAFACGRITMEESFTQKWYPSLEEFSECEEKTDFVPVEKSSFYAVAFDSKGKLGWKSNKIVDDDPGYNEARIIEVLTEQVDLKYLSYLRKMKIPYIFAGKTEIDICLALSKLKELFSIEKLLLEGGSEINGAFQRADAIDELSLVVCPLVSSAESKPLFFRSVNSVFSFERFEEKNNVPVLTYKKKD